MGQKVNPIGMRLGINKSWSSKWFVGSREYAKTLHEDLQIKKVLMNHPDVKNADVADIEIIRHPQKVTVLLYTSKPGMIIGQKGANIEKIRVQLQKCTEKVITVKCQEVKKPEANAQLIALNIARQLKGRSPFRKVCKQAISSAMRGGVQGIKVKLSGRLGGAEMSRAEEFKEGRIPLQTLRADIDYGVATADTTFGAIGVKVWVFNGLVYKYDRKDDAGAIVKKSKKPASESRRSKDA